MRGPPDHLPHAHIARCLDLQESDISEALATPETTRSLLARLAAVSAPNTGAAKALIVFARMATTACSWIDGDLTIDLSADGATTVIEAATELGAGLRERVLPPARFRAPLDEFARAIDRVPHMIAPLVVRHRSPTRVALSASDQVRRTTAPPPPIEIARDSLFEPAISPQRRPGAEPPDAAGDSLLPSSAGVDAGWDD